MRRPLRRTALVSVAAVAAVLTGCGGPPGTGDFKKQAEDFINENLDNDGQLNGLVLSNGSCEEPESTEVGTAYTCTADASDGQQRTLTVNIISSNKFQVQAIEPPVPEAASTPDEPVATTAPAAGSITSVAPTATTAPAG